MKTLYFKYFQPSIFFQTIHYFPDRFFAPLPSSPPRLYQSPQTFSSPCNRIFRLIAGDSSTNNRCPERKREREREAKFPRTRDAIPDVTLLACVTEIPGPAGGALRAEGDLHRAGENSGGTWGTIERREIGGRRIKGGRWQRSTAPPAGGRGDLGERSAGHPLQELQPWVQHHSSQGNQTF